MVAFDSVCVCPSLPCQCCHQKLRRRRNHDVCSDLCVELTWRLPGRSTHESWGGWRTERSSSYGIDDSTRTRTGRPDRRDWRIKNIWGLPRKSLLEDLIISRAIWTFSIIANGLRSSSQVSDPFRGLLSVMKRRVPSCAFCTAVGVPVSGSWWMIRILPGRRGGCRSFWSWSSSWTCSSTAAFNLFQAIASILGQQKARPSIRWETNIYI